MVFVLTNFNHITMVNSNLIDSVPLAFALITNKWVVVSELMMMCGKVTKLLISIIIDGVWRGLDANLNRHALRPSKQYWITCPRKLKSEFDRTPQPNVYK